MYYLTGVINKNWINQLNKLTTISYVDVVPEHLNSEDKIISLSLSGNICNKNNDNLVGNFNTINNIFNSNINFTKFMMNKYPNYIPKTIYYRSIDEQYLSEYNSISKFVIKNNYGGELKIVDNIDIKMQDVIISEYVPHSDFYAGHIFSINGVIIKKIYFKGIIAKNSTKNSGLSNYEILSLANFDQIFDSIFNDINYDGFMCINFTIIDNKPIIFEISPRAGGSLIYNLNVFNDFIDEIIKNQTK